MHFIAAFPRYRDCNQKTKPLSAAIRCGEVVCVRISAKNSASHQQSEAAPMSQKVKVKATSEELMIKGDQQRHQSGMGTAALNQFSAVVRLI